MNLDWLAEAGLERLAEFLTALAIGLLIGLERERNPTSKGGLRTFAFISLGGAAAAVLSIKLESPLIVAAGLASVAFMMVAAYYEHHAPDPDRDPGTTTVAAAIVCYLLGALTMTGFSQLAVMLAIICTTLLYFKTELGGFAHALERRDLISILQFAVVTFVVLPLLPDRAFGPFDVLNPRHIWLMVVVVSGVSLAGYVALRVVGHRYGPVLLGVFGGLVSSTATTLAYARRTRTQHKGDGIAMTVILTANLVLLVRLGFLGLVVAPGVLAVLLPVLGTALVSGIVAYAAVRHLDVSERDERALPVITNPAELPTALGFGALYAVVLVLAAWLKDETGTLGVYGLAVVSGVADVDAISLSALNFFGAGTLTARQASIAIAIAIVVNVVFKLCIVLVLGGPALFRRCAVPMLAVAVGIGAGLTMFARL